MSRYRLVTQTTNDNGTETHVSSVIQTLEEALAGMEVEEQLARATGWRTFWTAEPALNCVKGETVRCLTMRESGPFDDAVA